MKSNGCKVVILTVIILVAGCGNLYAPSSFSFVTLNNVPTSTAISSNVVTIEGNQFPASISFTNSSSAAYSLYSINGGAFSAGQSSDTLRPGDTLQIQQTSASTANTARSSTINVGGFITSFVTVTGSTVGGKVTATDTSGDTVTISGITATLSAADNIVHFSVTGATSFTNDGTNTSVGTGSTIPVTFTLQAVSNAGAVVYQATTPTSGTSLVSIPFGQTQYGLFSGQLPSTVNTLPAGLPSAINGYPPSTATYWTRTIAYWQIVPGSFKIVQ